MPYISQYLIFLLVTFLWGCSPASRYELDQDRGPDREIDVSHIPEPTPVWLKPGRRGNSSTYTVWGKTYQVMQSSQGYVEEGVASWYGEKFHGHETSNGEVYDMYQYSAAHKSLPLPVYARVTNLANGKQVIVRVNDRGPFHGNRLIDLSYSAAKKLEFLAAGTARVKVEAYPFVDSSADTGSLLVEESDTVNIAEVTKYFLQVGAYADSSAANRIVNEVSSLVTAPVFLQKVEVQSLYRVRVGPFEKQSEAYRAQNRLRSEKYPDTLLLTVSN